MPQGDDMKVTAQSASGEAMGLWARTTRFWTRLEAALAEMEMASTDLLELRVKRLADQVAQLTTGTHVTPRKLRSSDQGAPRKKRMA
jgi:hypothetical protein